MLRQCHTRNPKLDGLVDIGTRKCFLLKGSSLLYLQIALPSRLIDILKNSKGLLRRKTEIVRE
jgi:hypothetical protein